MAEETTMDKITELMKKKTDEIREEDEKECKKYTKWYYKQLDKEEEIKKNFKKQQIKKYVIPTKILKVWVLMN